MPKYSILKIGSQPGIQRDGTPYNAVNYTDGQWCRFWEGSPRKIGGYVYMLAGTDEPARNMYSVSKPSSINLYLGRASTVSFINLTYNGIPVSGGSVTNPTGNPLTSETYRTPITGFMPDENNLWDFDLFTDIDSSEFGGEATQCLVAQVAPNADDISNTQPGAVFFGSVNENTPLKQVFYDDGTPVQVSGGLVTIPPFVVAYGNDGKIAWNTQGNITSWPISNFITIGNTKVVKGFNLRGSSPSGILWTLNSIARISYEVVEGNFTFVSNTVDSSITVMSPDSIVEYDQMYFWVGTDQFYFYNGIVNKIPNTMNSNYFFENIDLTNRSKVWGMVIRKYSEIWWHYPRLFNQDGSKNTTGECNAVIIFNVQTNAWYDTWLSRGSGIPASIFPFPIMASNQEFTLVCSGGLITSYPIWYHEQANDEILYVSGNGNPTTDSDPDAPGIRYRYNAIKSWFTTAWIDLFSQDPNASTFLANRRIAPDFDYVANEGQGAAMNVVIANRTYPQDPPSYDPATDDPTINGYPFYRNTRFIDMSSQGAIINFTFTSNDVGGFYQMGKTLYFFEKGDTIK